MMKFNAYIVQLNHTENTFTGSLIIDGQVSSVNFTKIGPALFTANLKQQAAFSFLEKVEFKNKQNEVKILLPVLSKYNKRKLAKISNFLGSNPPEEIDRQMLVLELLGVEKFLRVQDLMDFFNLDRESLIDFLLEKEIRQQLKIIELTNLHITSYPCFRTHLEEMNALFTQYYTNRTKSIKYSDIEAKLKLPSVSLLFKYLVRRLTTNFSFKIQKDKIVFQKMALSDTEKDSILEIEDVVRKNKLSIFSIENIVTHSNFVFKEVNDTIWHLVENSTVVPLNDRYYIFREDLNKLLNKLKKFKRNEGEMIDIQSFRELTNYTRKYIIVLFEYFDAQRITQRVNNHRQILLSV
jgi:hypothetical protein